MTYVCVQAVGSGVLHVMVLEWGVFRVFFYRLTAHETALLIFAALMVVSFPPDQWTPKNKLSQRATLIQFK